MTFKKSLGIDIGNYILSLSKNELMSRFECNNMTVSLIVLILYVLKLINLN
jgi:hypothetical protein